MKRKLLLPVLALTAFLGTLLSCSSDLGTASIKIPVSQIFRNVGNDIPPSDTNKIKLEITLSGDAKDSHEFNWEEKEQDWTFENLPVGGVVSVSAKVKDGEDLIYSGKSDKIKLKNEQNETTITMQKLMARLTVKTDNEEITGLTDTTEIIIDAAAEGFPKSLTITPKEFAAGYELKYLPINKELTVTAEAKTTNTAIFRGSSKITITEKDQKPECTIKMERVNGDTSVEIQTLPTPELRAIYTNGNNTFSLKQDSEARFTISYTDSSTPNTPSKPLPNWVTYKWKMNDTEFTPGDASGQATFGMNEEGTELTLTISPNGSAKLSISSKDSKQKMLSGQYPEPVREQYCQLLRCLPPVPHRLSPFLPYSRKCKIY